MSIKLSILDQSPISEGSDAMEALKQTSLFAQKAEQWGYTRFWVSEHHDTKTLAGSSPEVLMAHLATVTSSIRIGSGGVMLPHYSAYKVAENFKLLEALFPGRIDAGIGRAPGGMPRATYALHDGAYRDVHKFPSQVDELDMYLNDRLPSDHPYYGLKATPVTKAAPPIWMLGSSPNSAALAAEKGLPYMYAQFINGESGPSSAAYYQREFQPSEVLQKPKQAVAVFFACAETEQEAERIISSLDLSILMMVQGMPSKGTPSPETAMDYPYSDFEKEFVLDNRKRMIIGTPKTVRAQVEKLAAEFGADEVMLVMRAYDFQDKLRSYELIAKEMLT